MRLERARFRSLGPFVDWTLDVTPYPEGSVIALVAPNGTGKTFALEAATVGLLYRSMETQGTLLGRATARDAMLEGTIVYGERRTIRHLLDPIAKPKKSEALLLGADGKTPVYDSTSVTAFDSWALKHLPTEDVTLATTVKTQGSESFIGLGSAERISVILQATGAAKIERMAQAARARRESASFELQTLLARIADARSNGPELAAVEAEAAEYRDASALAETRATHLRAAFADAEKELARVRALQVDADAARGKRSRIEADLAAAKERLAGLEKRAAEHDVAAARAEHERLTGIAAGGREAFVALEAEATRLKEQRAEAAKVEAERERLAAVVIAKRAELDTLDRAIAHGAALLADADQIRAAGAEVATLQVEIERAATRLQGAIERWVAEGGWIWSTDQRLEALDRRIERAEETLKGRPAVEAAQTELTHVTMELAAAEEAKRAAEKRVAELSEQRATGAEARIVVLRAGIEEAIESPHPVTTLTELVARDDETTERDVQLPILVREAGAATGKAAARFNAARIAEENTRRIASRAEAIRAAEDDRAAASAEREPLAAEHAARVAELPRRYLVSKLLGLRLSHLRDAMGSAQARAARADALTQAESAQALREAQATAARAALADLERDIASLRPPAAPIVVPDVAAHRESVDLFAEAARAAELRVAAVEATARELGPQLRDAHSRFCALTTELDQNPNPAAVPEAPDANAIRREGALAEMTAKNLAAELARAEERLVRAREVAARVAELETERATVEADLADWTRLSIDLGRAGIQADLVDSAGPELTELTTELLRCHGSRYTVSIDTRRPTSDGKGEIDECIVMVIDTVAGTEKEARQHSGGERVILSEAVSLALTVLACRRANVTGCTLVRDESGAALDPANARAYIAMLRRAVSMVGAHHVLLVSHSEAVVRMCDAVIEVPNQRGPRESARSEAAE